MPFEVSIIGYNGLCGSRGSRVRINHLIILIIPDHGQFFRHYLVLQQKEDNESLDFYQQ